MPDTQLPATQVGPLAQFRAELTRAMPEVAVALPSHIKPEKFQRVVQTVVSQSPELLGADRRSLFNACVKCASDGLIPDGREAALVIFNTNAGTKQAPRWVKSVQYMPMVAGLLKRMRNTGEIATVEAHTIHEHDEFIWSLGDDGGITHKPRWPGDRGKMIGVYAIAHLKSGEIVREVATVDEIDKIRAVSKSKDGPAWSQWYDQMARAKVLRRLAKWLPMDPEDRLTIEALADRGDSALPTLDASPAAPAVYDAPSRLDLLEGSLADETVDAIVDDGGADETDQKAA